MSRFTVCPKLYASIQVMSTYGACPLAIEAVSKFFAKAFLGEICRLGLVHYKVCKASKGVFSRSRSLLSVLHTLHIEVAIGQSVVVESFSKVYTRELYLSLEQLLAS